MAKMADRLTGIFEGTPRFRVSWDSRRRGLSEPWNSVLQGREILSAAAASQPRVAELDIATIPPFPEEFVSRPTTPARYRSP